MKRALLILALAMAPLRAQSQTNSEERVARIVHLKYVNPNAVRYLVQPFGASVTADEKMMVVTLNGPRSLVDAAEAAVKQLDVPSAAQKDVDLTVYFVVGSDEATPTGSPIPPDLQSTVAALKQTFPFKSYSLLDALSIRSLAGSAAEVSGRLSGNRITDFSVRSVTVEPEGTTLKLERVRAHLRVPMTEGGKTNYVDTGIDAELVGVKEGQKLVIGRSSLEGSGKALFLVLIARVAQ
jgi:type II secretory pathway component GspD/PulD (secretin)